MTSTTSNQVQPTAGEFDGLLTRAPDAAQRESYALIVSAAAAVLVGGIAFLVFWGGTVPIAGPGSVGTFVSFAAALVAAVSFALSFLLDRFTGRAERRGRLPRRIFDLAALAITHGLIGLVVWAVISTLLQHAFLDADMYGGAAAIFAAVAAGLTAYAAFLSGAGMNSTRLSSIFALFLVSGVFTSMLTATDPQWWTMNLSALGMNDSFSSTAFNVTLILAGFIVTTLANFVTGDLQDRAQTTGEVTRTRLLTAALVVLGLALAGVGLVPVNVSELIHNISSSTLLVLFAVLAISIRWLVPGLPTAFLIIGYVFVGICVVAVVLWLGPGYYNLTAVEIIGAAAFLAWLVILIRNLAAHKAVPSLLA